MQKFAFENVMKSEGQPKKTPPLPPPPSPLETKENRAGPSFQTLLQFITEREDDDEDDRAEKDEEEEEENEKEEEEEEEEGLWWSAPPKTFHT